MGHGDVLRLLSAGDCTRQPPKVPPTSVSEPGVTGQGHSEKLKGQTQCIHAHIKSLCIFFWLRKSSSEVCKAEGAHEHTAAYKRWDKT